MVFVSEVTYCNIPVYTNMCSQDTRAESNEKLSIWSSHSRNVSKCPDKVAEMPSMLLKQLKVSTSSENEAVPKGKTGHT